MKYNTIYRLTPADGATLIKIESVACCGNDGCDATDVTALDTSMLAELSISAGSHFIKAKGPSMEPAGIHDGDLVFFRPSLPYSDGEMVVVTLNGDVYVKYLNFDDDRQRTFLSSADETFGLIEVTPADQVRIEGRVIVAVSPHRAAHRRFSARDHERFRAQLAKQEAAAQAAAQTAAPEEPDVLSDTTDAGHALCIALSSRRRAMLDAAEAAHIIRYVPERQGYAPAETSSHTLVAYFCGRLFCRDSASSDGLWQAGGRFEMSKLIERLFGFDVARVRRSMRGRGRGAAPKGYQRVDALFTGD